VGFTISQLVVSSVNGRFKDVGGKGELDEADLTKSQVDLSNTVDSIDTDEPKRNEHLKGRNVRAACFHLGCELAIGVRRNMP